MRSLPFLHIYWNSVHRCSFAGLGHICSGLGLLCSSSKVLLRPGHSPYLASSALLGLWLHHRHYLLHLWDDLRLVCGRCSSRKIRERNLWVPWINLLYGAHDNRSSCPADAKCSRHQMSQGLLLLFVQPSPSYSSGNQWKCISTRWERRDTHCSYIPAKCQKREWGGALLYQDFRSRTST